MPTRTLTRPSDIVRILVLSVVAALVLAACGGEDAEQPDGEGSPTGAATGELDLVNEGQLTVCSDIPYPPFEFTTDEGDYAGFDIDLMREIATALDLELNVRETPFDGIFASLETGECDVVASAVTITEEREQQMDFTDPYFDADQSLLIRAEDSDQYSTLDDLAGESIGVQTGTTGAQYAEENAPEDSQIIEFEDAGAMFAAIETGEVAALLQDFPVNAERAAQDENFEVTETFPTGEQYGFAVQQGDDALREAINGELERMRDDGTYDEIFEEYFGQSPDETRGTPSDDATAGGEDTSGGTGDDGEVGGQDAGEEQSDDGATSEEEGI